MVPRGGGDKVQSAERGPARSAGEGPTKEGEGPTKRNDQSAKTGSTRAITDDDYRRLLALRTDLRRFLHWSEEQARAAGIASSQHQLLLAIRGHHDRRGPTIGDVADCLILRHHSAAELAQRTEAVGLIRRMSDPSDGRLVRLTLTRQGAGLLRRLSRRHLQELDRLADHLGPLWAGLEDRDE